MLSFVYAFSLGILSIASPCTFVMVPVILGKMRASTIEMLQFFSGVLFIFSFLGLVASLTGNIFTNALNRYIYLVAGMITLISGFTMLGAIRIEYPSLSLKFHKANSFLSGLIYGGAILGCIGPLLAAVLSFIVAAGNFAIGIFIMIFFSLGFLTPFIIFSVIVKDREVQKKIIQHSVLFQKIGGILMLSASVYLFYFGLRGLI